MRNAHMESANTIHIQRTWRGRRSRRDTFAIWTRLYRSMLGNIIGKTDASFVENRVEKVAYDLAVDHVSKEQTVIYAAAWKTVREFSRKEQCDRWKRSSGSYPSVCREIERSYKERTTLFNGLEGVILMDAELMAIAASGVNKRRTRRKRKGKGRRTKRRR